MPFFKGFGHRLRRYFEPSPETLVKRGIRAQEEYKASKDQGSYKSQYFFTKAAMLFSEARNRYQERNDDTSLVRILFSLANIDLDLYFSEGKPRERLDRVLKTYEEALRKSLSLPQLPSDYVDLLTNTAYAYKERFQQWHARSDVDKSIKYYDDALQRTPSDPPGHIELLQVIGSIYWKLYCDPDCTGTRTDDNMEKANDFFQRAYDLCTLEDKSIKANCAYTLACISYAKFQKGIASSHSEPKVYLDFAIKMYCSAINLMSSEHPYYLKALRAISLILWYRYKEYHQKRDLQDARRFSLLALRCHVNNTEENQYTDLVEIVAGIGPEATAPVSPEKRSPLIPTTPNRSPTAFSIRYQGPASPTHSIFPYNMEEGPAKQASPHSIKAKGCAYLSSATPSPRPSRPSSPKTSRNIHVQLSINTKLV